jgi:two-component system CheB/CheR fusion protein
MNEELQSTNEELETMNEELRRRTLELDSLNEFMELIMASMHSAVVVTDADLRVQIWNYMAEELWGLRAPEVEGKVLTNLDIGLRFDGLAKRLHAVAGGADNVHGVVLDAVNRRGKNIKVRVSCDRLSVAGAPSRGLLILMEVVQ